MRPDIEYIKKWVHLELQLIIIKGMSKIIDERIQAIKDFEQGLDSLHDASKGE
jgi:hypothetical protein